MFVIPTSALGELKTIKINSDPRTYAGRWARYRQFRTITLEEEMDAKRLTRIKELIAALHVQMHMELPATNDRDINEVLGEYDGRLLAMREQWDELMLLISKTRNDGAVQ